MADGDVFHNRLDKRYQRLYQKVDQGAFAPEALAHQALRPLIKDLAGVDSSVVSFLQDASHHIEMTTGLPLLNSVLDRDAIKRDLAALAMQMDGDQRANDTAVEVCERYLNRFPDVPPTDQLASQLIYDFIKQVYTARFESIAMLAPDPTRCKHPPLSDPATQATRLREMRPYLTAMTESMARQVAQSGSFAQLRRPPALQAHVPVDPDEALPLPKR